MTMINAILNNEESEPMSVHLKSGTLISGIFKGIENDLLKINDAYVICHSFQYSTRWAIVEVEAVEMCLPGEKELSFNPI
jgi:hypothetical protein